MKKVLSMAILLTVMLAVVASCTAGPIVQVKTPVPGSNTGTSAPNGQVNLPAVSIQINAPGPNPELNTPTLYGSSAGILMGVWHGIISPVTLVVSFLNKDTQMYEVHNNGSQYNLGFFLGIALLFVLLGGIAGSGRR